jgi:hypothetical protein
MVLHRHHDWTVMEQNHLSAAEIAGFIDRTLENDVRALAVEHLATCERCRDEVAACARLAASAPVKRTVPVVWRAVAAMVAVVVLAVALRSTWDQGLIGARRVTAERATSTVSRVRVVFPTDTVPIARSRLRFVWRRDLQATGYSLAVDDASGDVIWSGEINDTTFTLPDSARLAPSGLYYWHVDALHVDGSSAQSGATAFRVAP